MRSSSVSRFVGEVREDRCVARLCWTLASAVEVGGRIADQLVRGRRRFFEVAGAEPDAVYRLVIDERSARLPLEI
jgi:hypothetical protein